MIEIRLLVGLYLIVGIANYHAIMSRDTMLPYPEKPIKKLLLILTWPWF